MAISTVDLGPVKGPKGDKGDTGTVDANTPLTYTESTAETAPETGSKLGLIIGWCVGKIKALTTSVSQLNSNKQNSIAVFTKNIQLQVSNGAAGSSVDMKQTGYTLLGVVGYKTGNSNYTISEITIGDNSIYFSCRHVNDISATGIINASFRGLYTK